MKLYGEEIEKLEIKLKKLREKESKNLERLILPFLRDASKCSVKVGLIQYPKLQGFVNVECCDNSFWTELQGYISKDSISYNAKCKVFGTSLTICAYDSSIFINFEPEDFETTVKKLRRAKIPLDFSDTEEEHKTAKYDAEKALEIIKRVKKL
jgi:hypothetical protein